MSLKYLITIIINMTKSKSTQSFKSKYSVVKYGKGYHLKDSSKNPKLPDHLKAIEDSGWWQETHGGWFFKTKYLHLLDLALEKSTKSTKSKYSVVKYGKGYHLKDSSKNPKLPDHLKAIEDSGWWQETHGGWFFKTKYLSLLKKLVKPSKSTKSKYSGIKYNKGYNLRYKSKYEYV